LLIDLDRISGVGIDYRFPSLISHDAAREAVRAASSFSSDAVIAWHADATE